MSGSLPRLLLRMALAVLGVGLGAAIGLCTVAVHATGWGLVLGLAATVSTIVALGGGWWRRFAFAVGWSGAVLVLSMARPEGDYWVSSDLLGYLLLIAVPAVFVGGMVGIRFRTDAAHAAGEDSGSGGPVS
ncbi:hypothetical protein FXB39_09780 [Nocardioides sp. BGMRC 2183]|nr:hypothetical protein FXB39_09780 [Nocardioides sp. BGMRC 2183]